MRHLLLIIPLWMLPGCDEPKLPANIHTFYDMPPFRVVQIADRGLFSSGWYTEDDFRLMMEVALNDAKAHLWKYGVTPEQVEALCRGISFDVVDDWNIKTIDSPTGYAAGIEAPGLIWVTLWQYHYALIAGAADPPPWADAPPWTVYPVPWNTKYMSWGSGPHYCPALGHELGHAIWGPDFEHTWTPPIVN